MKIMKTILTLVAMLAAGPAVADLNPSTPPGQRYGVVQSSPTFDRLFVSKSLDVGVTAQINGEAFAARRYFSNDGSTHTISMMSNSDYFSDIADGGSPFYAQYAYSNGAGVLGGMSFFCSRGTKASPNTSCKTNDELFIGFKGNNGSGATGSKATIELLAAEDWTPSANGTSISFKTTATGTTARQLAATVSESGIWARSASGFPGNIIADGDIEANSFHVLTSLENEGETELNGNVGIGPAYNIGFIPDALSVDGAGLFSSSVTASAFFGNGSHLTGIRVLPDSTDILTSGSGTYTVPLGAQQLEIEIVGGGGGGASDENGGGGGSGADGSDTTFDVFVASHGSGGKIAHSGGQGGAGGTGGGGSGVEILRIAGQSGMPSGVAGCVGGGGSSHLGFAPQCVIAASSTGGVSAPDNSGAGGSTAQEAGGGGGGGGGGEYRRFVIDAPDPTYSVSVGAGGAGGTGLGTSGGAGGSGIIIIRSIYATSY